MIAGQEQSAHSNTCVHHTASSWSQNLQLNELTNITPAREQGPV